METLVRALPWAILFATCALFLSLHGLPFLDLPNHATRSWIIGELLWGERFQELFAVDLLFTPYILGDLILAHLYRLFSLETGALVYLSGCFLSLPLGLTFYQRSRGIAPALSSVMLCLAAFLATNWYFLASYTNYSLSLGLVFFTLGSWERLVRRPGEKSWRWALLFCLGTTLTYLAHLSGLLFLCLLLGGSITVRLLSRRLPLLQACLTIAPFVALWTIHLSRETSQADLNEAWLYRTPYNKLLAFGSMFFRFNLAIDSVLVLLFIALLILALHAGRDTKQRFSQQYLPNSFRPASWWRSFQSSDSAVETIELILLVLGLTTLFLILPVGMAAAYDIDGRALPFLFSYLILLVFQQVKFPDRALPSLRAGAFLLALGNLVYLGWYLEKHNHRLVAFNQLLASIPRGASVLPVATAPDEGRIQTGLHNGALYSAVGEGLTPYIFSSAHGQPVTYFHYRRFPQAPLIFWYLRKLPVNWPQIAGDYQFLVIAKPFDRSRLELPGLEVLAENESGTVFAINSR